MGAWSVVRNRLVPPPALWARHVLPALAGTVSGSLLLRRLLLEEYTRRELPSLAGPAPVHRSPPVIVQESAPERRATGRADRGEPYSGETELPAVRPGAAPAGVAALDVERLTDQVVRKIDERILAHRERVGKVF
jgi:hypothetical protein